MKKSYMGLILKEGYFCRDWKKYTKKERILQCVQGYLGTRVHDNDYKLNQIKEKEVTIEIVLMDLTGYDHVYLTAGGWIGSYKKKEIGPVPLERFSEHKITLPKLRKNGSVINNNYLRKNGSVINNNYLKKLITVVYGSNIT